jgi:polyhydroxybutyrate depolymerase
VTSPRFICILVGLFVSLGTAACSGEPRTLVGADETEARTDGGGRGGSHAGAGAGTMMGRSTSPAGRAADAARVDGGTARIDASGPDAVADADVGPESGVGAKDGGIPTLDRCGEMFAGGDYRELQVGGETRRYLLQASQRTAADLPALIVDLHGLLTHAAFERATSGFAALANDGRAVVAFPEALDGAWSLRDDSCCAVAPVDDVAFVRAVVDGLVETGCVDPKRVYAVGASAGGGLAQELACRAADRFAAAVSRDFDLLSDLSMHCQPSRPIAVLSLRDMATPSVPYGAGSFRPANGLNRTFSSLGAAASFQRWSQLNQCQGEAEARNDGCRAYAACSGGVEVETCASSDADVATAWSFLRRFTLP